MNDAPSIKELQNALLRDLGIELGPLGFKPRLRQQEYSRESAGVGWVVHVGFVRHKADVDATLDIGVRIDAVEDALRRAGFGGKGSVTVGAELGNLTDRRPRRWTIGTEAQAAQVAREMAAEVGKFGIGWLQRFSSLDALYEALVQNDRGSWLISPLHLKRCLVLVAVGKVHRGADAARVVAKECHAFLDGRNDPQLAVFDAHADKLLGME